MAKDKDNKNDLPLERRRTDDFGEAASAVPRLGADEISERARALELLLEVARSVNAAPSVAAAFRHVIDAVCDYLDWPIGHAYAVVPAAEGRFRDLDVWSARARREHPELVAAWRSIHPRAGEGLLGDVVPDAVSFREVAELDGLLRRRSDSERLPKVAVLVPVRAADRVVAVVEFYRFGEQPPPRDAMLSVLDQVGFELGHIVERQQSMFRGLRRQQSMERVARLALVGELAGGIAHQLNQPLTAIMNYVAAGRRMLERGELNRRRMIEIGNQIETQTKRAAAVMEQVRSFVRSQAPRVEPVDVGEVLRAAAALIAPLVRASGVDVRIEAAPGLQAVTIDRGQFEHVIVNLLLNAAEAMEEGDPGNRVIEVRAEQKGADYLRISVRDYGRGISEELLPRLFEPFVSTKPGGSGMGLPVSRSIVESYGGNVRVEPAPGCGTIFHLELPTSEERGQEA